MQIFSLILMFCFSAQVFAADKLQYFESKIDFWGEKTNAPETKVATITPKEKSDEKFPWKTYLDPKNKEFFKEGDYTPPEPFMEVARNPSDENIKQWFELMAKKNDLQTRLQARMQEYMVKNGSLKDPNPTVSEATPKPPVLPSKKEPDVAVDPTRFKVRMYFESTCPHCRRMFGVLKQLQASGFVVEALQVDRGVVPDEEKIVSIARADPTDLKKHNISGVPFLLVADSKRKALLPAIQGYHSLEEILRMLKAASRI